MRVQRSYSRIRPEGNPVSTSPKGWAASAARMVHLTPLSLIVEGGMGNDTYRLRTHCQAVLRPPCVQVLVFFEIWFLTPVSWCTLYSVIPMYWGLHTICNTLHGNVLPSAVS
jgi:hypothetical protein